MSKEKTGTVDFCEFCYSLYKEDWKRSHNINEMEYIAKWYGAQQRLNPDEQQSYEDYIFDRGYDGNIYACFSEFLDTEFVDDEYMEHLLKDKSLISMYKTVLESVGED